MIIDLCETTPAQKPIRRVEWKRIPRPTLPNSPVMVEFQSMMFAMPILFLAGIFTGVGVMLAIIR